ncbi:MAG: 50S ribosomal protein L6 [Phycisphaerae bacterium]|nr:50S ribosomal protein L6 [Phycisphaerae bacterium]
MSRIGNKPVPIAKGVQVEITRQTIKVSGQKGNLSWTVPEPITAAVVDNQVVVKRPNNVSQTRALHGLSRALIANMVKGVSEGYEKKLEVYGTGYSANVQGQTLMLSCGYMGRGVGKKAQFEIPIPAGLEVKVETPAARGNTEPAKFTVSGADKQAVGQFAAEIRKIRKPEPYLGKGIRYAGEHVRRKAGKVFAAGAA